MTISLISQKTNTQQPDTEKLNTYTRSSLPSHELHTCFCNTIPSHNMKTMRTPTSAKCTSMVHQPVKSVPLVYTYLHKVHTYYTPTCKKETPTVHLPKLSVPLLYTYLYYFIIFLRPAVSIIKVCITIAINRELWFWRHVCPHIV